MKAHSGMAVLLLFSGAVAAQSTPAVPAVTPTPTLRTNSNLVLIDVVASAKGVPVRGLESGQIRVFENGKEQKISSFEEHVPPPVAAAAPTPGQAAPVRTVSRMTFPPDTYSDQPAYDATGAATVLLLDALNTPVVDQMRARQQMVQYLADVGRTNPGVRMAVFTLASRLRMVQDFTADGSVLARAASVGAQPSSLLAVATDSSLNSIANDISSLDPDANATSSMQQFAADDASFQTDLRVRMTLEAMQQLARYLSAVPGRKNLIWFSGSFPLTLDPDKTLPFPFSVLRNYSDDLKQTSEMLSASRVAVYPIDARGLLGLPSSDASHTASAATSMSTLGPGIGGRRGGGGRGQRSSSSRSGTSMPATASDDQKFLDQLSAEHAAMRQIAEDTGGAAFVNTNGLKEAVQQATTDGETYYTIGYTPADANFDGRYRKVEVRVEKTRYALAYRRGYYATAPEVSAQGLRAKLVASATMHGALPSSEVKFTVRVLPAGDARLKNVKLQEGAAGEMAGTLMPPLARYAIDFVVDPRGLGLAQGTDGKEHAKVEFLAIAYDADGKRLNYADKGFAFAVKSEQMRSLIEQGLPERLELDLPSGKTSLRLSVHDLATDKVGSIEVPLVVTGEK